VRVNNQISDMYGLSQVSYSKGGVEVNTSASYMFSYKVFLLNYPNVKFFISIVMTVG